MRKRGLSLASAGAVIAAMLVLGACSRGSAEAPRRAETGAGGAGATCDVASVQSVVPADTTIVAADTLDTPVPHCRIEGYVTTTNPGPNRNNFRLQLPARELWEGRYYFIGLGGSAGYVPTDSQLPRGNPMVKGFAVAGTDTGHTAHLLDWGFLADPAQAMDHIHRGAHVVAVATQQITRAYYGTDTLHRYHSGCSGGGRMGSEAIQRYPEDFDGMLIGGNAGLHRLRPDSPRWADWANFVSMVREMTREPGSWLSPAKLKFAEEKVTAACDMTDGVRDDVIWDHRRCAFDFKTLKCAAGDAPDCLTQPEITSIENLLRDTRMPISNMGDWTFLGAVPPPWDPTPSVENMPQTSAALVILTTWARTYLNQPDRDIVAEPLTDAEIATMGVVQKQVGFSAPVNPDLEGIEAAGTKIIFWNGVSDSCCSNVSLEESYVDLAQTRNGDLRRVAEFAQLYHIPGMAHCGGGTGPDDAPDQLLQAMIEWVEQGRAPAAVETHRGADRATPIFAAARAPAESGVSIPVAGGASRDFLICPFPQVSVFDASQADVPGAVYEAGNWTCRMPGE